MPTATSHCIQRGDRDRERGRLANWHLQKSDFAMWPQCPVTSVSGQQQGTRWVLLTYVTVTLLDWILAALLHREHKRWSVGFMTRQTVLGGA